MQILLYRLRLACFFVALLTSLQCKAEELPTALRQLFPVSYVVMTYAMADLNGDGNTDYVVVLRSKLEDALLKKGQPAPRRPLLVFLHGAANTFKLVGRNDKVVFAADEGGQCDPFLDGEEGLAVKASYFTVQNSVACGQHWTDYFTFRYSQEQRGIVFHKRISESWVMNASATGDALVLDGRKVVSAKKNKPVLLGDYAP